ncbi:hypothetical protein NX059_010058 [Plenodomus lindquistii]|nr:hypothetical protein NX059_010058 [Plenodomus lindquistii]
MKAVIFLLGALTTAVFPQNGVFESADFNVTEALIGNGVNVSAIPQLAGLVDRTSLSGCSIACSSLNLIYGKEKLLSEGTAEYDAFTGGYWSAQHGGVNPHCVFQPSSTVEVSSLVLSSRLTQCPFAVKGGGHAAFGGGSSIDGGITVSMEGMKQVQLSKDKKTVDVGPGNRWVDVYSQLDPLGVGVAGGRMGPVGVSGLLLGGGISFFANKLGCACDNVVSYEVVTASGVVVTASPNTWPDLYWALRGGGGNFGIITNFKLSAFPLGKMWGGQRIFTRDKFVAVLDAIYNFATVGSPSDTDAAAIVSFGYVAALGNVAITQMHYAHPISNATVFSDLNAIPYLTSDTNVSSLDDLTIRMNGGRTDGEESRRQTMWDVTFKVDRELFTFLTDTFYALVPHVQDLIGFAAISIQVITEGQLKGMQKNGGNALGLDPSKGPFFVMNMSCDWGNAANDAAILKFFSTIIKKVKAEAQRRGLDNDYIYMNYASEFQNPLASYGAANVKKLLAVSKKYDPAGVFQSLHLGYFKLAKGPPNPNMPSKKLFALLVFVLQ